MTVPTRRSDPLQPLRSALELLDGSAEGIPGVSGLAPTFDAALRSAIRAVTAGRQQKRNLEPIMRQARTAFVRTLRRRATR